MTITKTQVPISPGSNVVVTLLKQEEDKPLAYFGKWEVMSCPKCEEAMKLGNKYYNQMATVLTRINGCALEMTPENFESLSNKFDGLNLKFDKIQKEFVALVRGRTRCCCPQWMLDDYMKAWDLK